MPVSELRPVTFTPIRTHTAHNSQERATIGERELGEGRQDGDKRPLEGMVYTHNWAVFAAEATRLFDHSPSTVSCWIHAGCCSWLARMRIGLDCVLRRLAAHLTPAGPLHDAMEPLEGPARPQGHRRQACASAQRAKQDEDLDTLLTLCTFSQCLKFKSRSSVILNRFEQLTVNLTSRMQDRQFSSAIPPRVEASSGAVAAPLSANASATDAAKDAAASSAAGPGAGAIASRSAPPKDDAGTSSTKTPSKKKGKGGKKGGKK